MSSKESLDKLRSEVVYLKQLNQRNINILVSLQDDLVDSRKMLHKYIAHFGELPVISPDLSDPNKFSEKE